ncbi:hypothetical protein NC652_037276 [Populus alba x Populus x berolinensis]|nr:hypothetical protein NC652_037276 [Populus alba x Populus x berolinensis]
MKSQSFCVHFTLSRPLSWSFLLFL